MKQHYLLLLVFFISFATNAQVINIPDANFKAKLLAANPSNTIASNGALAYIKVDTNNDNEIDVAEALQVSSLDVSISNIYDMTGIEFFTNLRALNCSQNHIPAIDVSNLTSLNSLFCSLNLLTNLDLTGLTQLTNLECAENTLSQINFADVTNIRNLNCRFNFLTELSVNNLPNLQTLNCNYNQLTTLNVSNLHQLTDLECQSNQFTSLNLSALINLTTLNCSFNQLTALNLIGLNAISILNCTHNQIAAFDISNLNNVSLLNCEFNQISTPFVFSNMADLHSLYCHDNLIPSITFSDTLNLEVLDCSTNSLVTLDTSSLSALSVINCYDNPLLTNLNIKNGSEEQFINFSGNQNLNNICADASQIATIENLIADYGYTNCQVNALCDLATPNFETNTTFLVFPNPTKNLLHLQMNENDTQKSIYVYNLLGQKIMTATNTKNVANLDVSQLKTGTYIIKIVTDKGTASQQFIKE